MKGRELMYRLKRTRSLDPWSGTPAEVCRSARIAVLFGLPTDAVVSPQLQPDPEMTPSARWSTTATAPRLLPISSR